MRSVTRRIDQERQPTASYSQLCRTLPEAERLALLARLVPLLADEDQIELLDEVVKIVGSNVTEQLEKELLARQGNQPSTSPSDPQP